MKSTLGKVSAVMILLVFLIASILVLNIAKAQNDTALMNQSNVSIDVSENLMINDAVGNDSSSDSFSVETFLNILVDEAAGIVGSVTGEIPEENEIPNETSNETSPEFVVSLGSGRITRGETVSLNAYAENRGDLARNVHLDWVLPEGFEIVSGNQRETCGDIDIDGSCYSEITVMVDPSLEIGLNEIKVVVEYEE
jgi:hypothetical protein